MADVIDLFDKPYFAIGLRLGFAALVFGWLLFLVRRSVVPIVGVLVAVATLATLQLAGAELGASIPAVLLIVAAVAATRLFKSPAWIKAVASLPGAFWLAVAAPFESFWIRVLTVVTVPLIGMLIGDFEMRHDGLGLGVVFFTIATLGLFAAVPDTEWALSLMAVSVVLTFLSWPKVAGSLGSEGAYAAVAVFILVAGVGGSGRPPSVLGSIACLGLLILEPVVTAIKPSVVKLTTLPSRTWGGAMVASLPQLVLVLVSSRIAARFDQFLPTVMVIGVAYVAGGIVAVRLTDSIEVKPRASV